MAFGVLAMRHLVPCHQPLRHHEDAGMETHGSLEEPIVVEDKRRERKGRGRPPYIQWEYDHIGRVLTVPRFCLQELHVDPERDRWVDRLVARDIRGEHHAFYFGISEQMKVGREDLQKAYEKMKAEGKTPDAETDQ